MQLILLQLEVYRPKLQDQHTVPDDDALPRKNNFWVKLQCHVGDDEEFNGKSYK